MHEAAEELVSQLGQTQLAASVVEQILFTGFVPQGNMGVTAVAGESGERLGHEGRAQAVVLGDGLGHELEEHVAVGGLEAIVVIPVHFELAVAVLVIVLIRVPAEPDHGVANLGDDIEMPGQGRLVVAGLGLGVRGASEIALPSALIRKYSHSTPVLMR